MSENKGVLVMFDNFISLGSYCGVAASMSKIGIRSVSGPFDWLISSDLKSVGSCMENDFSDFLNKENLVVTHGGMGFTDIKHSFYFWHDIKNSFEEDYEFIYEKYMRRINYFKEQIKHKTCFIRAVYSVDEFKYIQANQQFINSIIKKFHKDNEIIYVVNKSILGGGVARGKRLIHFIWLTVMKLELEKS